MKLPKLSAIALVAAVGAAGLTSVAVSTPAANATTPVPPSIVCTENDAGSPLVVGANCRTVNVDGLNREYIVVVPPHGVLSDPHDVVFVFHGNGGTGEDFSDEAGWTALAAMRSANFITVFPTAKEAYVCGDRPCAYTNRFNGYFSTPTATPTLKEPVGIDPAVVNPPSPVDDLAFFDAMHADLMDTTATTVGVNPNRVFAAGFSSGACMALKVGYEKSSIISAVAAVTGCAPENPTTAPSRDIPISYSINANDPWVFGETGPFLSFFPAAAVNSAFGVEVFQALATKSGRDLSARRALQWSAIKALAAQPAPAALAQYPGLQPFTTSAKQQTWIWWATPLTGRGAAAPLEVTIATGNQHHYVQQTGVSPALSAWAFFNRTVPR